MRLPPAIYGKSLYAGSDDGALYCLDAKSGKLLWKYRPAPVDKRLPGNGRMISACPVRSGICIDNGIVYFGEGDSPYLRGLDVANGKEVFTAQINQDGTMYGCYGQPGFGYGKLVVSSLDGVYCLE